MSETFRKIVNAPHRAFGRARQKITAQNPTSTGGKIARGAGIGLSGMMQFLLWATKYFALDNHATRAMERGFSKMTVGKNKEGNPKKISSFAKKYPNLSSHLLYYTMLAMVAGGVKGYDALNSGERDEAIRTENTIGIDVDNIPVYEENTYGAYLAKMQPITPLLIAHLVSLEGVRMNDDGMHVVYDDANGKILKPGDNVSGKATIGFGSTVLKDGKSVTSYTPPITPDAAYELARHHLEVGETYFDLYCYETGLGNVQFDSTSKAMMVASFLYNGGTDMIEEKSDKNHQTRAEQLRALYKEYGFGTPDSLVRELFVKYPVENPTAFGKVLMGIDTSVTLGDRAGMYLRANGKLAPGLVYRRWIEAGLLSGDIKPIEILDLPVDGLPEFYKLMCNDVGGDKKKAFFVGDGEQRRVNKATYAKFHQWLQNPIDRHGHSMAKHRKLSDVLPENVVQICRSGQCQVGNITAVIRPMERVAENKTDSVKKTDDVMSVQESTYVIGYDQQYTSAVQAFRAGRYEDAAAQFDSMIAQFPGNALLHNDMAATCNKLGRYDDAIEHARIVLHDIGDKSQYSAAQYNAGVAYEKKGDFQRALANYKLAVANGNKRVQRDVTRMSNKLKSGRGATGRKSGGGKKSKGATAFNSGKNQVKANAFMKGLTAFNRNNNNMA
ncbi:MAG: tetratricopeptide repeat protein [Muribaculaceae bacterium]|nr:tetratricopeptide repeat protein [Muribaculaceae bacterium]